MGEEEFYIDNITNLFIENVLTEQEKQFNLNILYGKDVSVEQIISVCKKYPLNSLYQIVLIKEAQDLSRSFDGLIDYFKQPLNSTILIINYKHKSIDKRKSFFKVLQKNAKIFESKKLYDNQVQNWITETVSLTGFSIDRKSVVLINEHLGNSLSKISNELDKLFEIKKKEKEAQDLSRSFDGLIDYFKQPLNSTILIINYKHKSIDKRKSFFKVLQKNAKIFESKKLYDNQVQNWITETVSLTGFSIDRKSVVLINEHLGNSLSKISNELDKLFEIKKKEKVIEPADIEKYVGISKEFNNFELRKALGEKNYNKAFQIAQYFTENPSSNPLVVTISTIFDFFNKLLIFHSNQSLEDRKMASILGVNPYFLNEYKLASSNYNLKEVVKIISLIRDYDMYSKGVGIKKADSFLLKEMVVRIININ